MEGKTLHQRKDYDSFYGDAGFIVVVWNRTGRVSQRGLCSNRNTSPSRPTGAVQAMLPVCDYCARTLLYVKLTEISMIILFEAFVEKKIYKGYNYAWGSKEIGSGKLLFFSCFS